MIRHFVVFVLVSAGNSVVLADDFSVSYGGFDGPGKGKTIVLVSGDEEYRSEETLPQLAKILARHHGFKCIVLFALDKKTGLINPNQNDNIPGLGALQSADLMVMFTRFRNLPDEQMRPIADYVNSGKPIVGLRTATHAFANGGKGNYGKYDWRSKDWPGGFGKQVLGETWVSHHGKHGVEGTRGIIVPGMAMHPILRGIKDGDIFGPTDVYTVSLPLRDCEPLVLGQVTTGLTRESTPVKGKKNEPMMPIAWTRTFTTESGKKARVFTTTMGASQDFECEGVRRLLVNACFWALGMETNIDDKLNVNTVGTFTPSPFRTNGFRPGIKPSDHAMKDTPKSR